MVAEFRFTVEESDIIDEADSDGILGPDAEKEQTQAALAKLPNKRTKQDCEVLQRATAGVKFFKQMNDPEQVLELCRTLTLKNFGAGQQVFKQGDEGSTFYIIFSGGIRCVEVYVNDFKSGKEGIGECVVKLSVGDAFGELALLGTGTRAATIVTKACLRTELACSLAAAAAAAAAAREGSACCAWAVPGLLGSGWWPS